MKLLLRRNVARLGGVGDVVDVRPGYARNYLLPYGLGIEPTEANIKSLESDKHARLLVEAETRKELESLVAKLDKVEVTIIAKANEQGHLFGAIHAKEIVAALAEEGFIVQESVVELDDAIRQLDKYQVFLRLADDLKAEIAVWIVPEKLPDGEEDAGEQETDSSADDDA